MTLPWEKFEDIIKELYAEHTLNTVRRIMDETYDFRASVRAYRQRLDAWGCSKYKPRKDRTGLEPRRENPENTQSVSPSPSQSYQQQCDSAGLPSSAQSMPASASSSGTSPWAATTDYAYGNTPGWLPTTINQSYSDGLIFTSPNMDYSNGNNGSYWHPDDQWHTHADDISNICYYDNSTQAAQQIPATYVTSAVTDMEEHDSDEDQPKEQPEEQPEDQPEYQGH